MKRLNKRDHYDVLGVSKGASGPDIKKAFYKLAKKYHPDTSKEPDAQKKFSEISAAYDILSDKEKREKYDMFGHDGEQMGDAGAGFQGMNMEDLFSELFGGGRGGGGGGGGGGFNPFGGGMGGGDPFGGMGGGRGRKRPSRGRDVQTSLRIDFMEAVKGCKRSIQVRTQDSCETCTGSGEKEGTMSVCRACGGSGMMTQSQGIFQMQMPCHQCHGEGRSAEACGPCGGRGTIAKNKEVSVSIPAGVDNDSNVRLRDQGDAGKLGGPRGHLFIHVQVTPHRQFKRDGLDVHLDVPISVSTAALGGKVAVPTLDNEVTLKVKPGTQPGTTSRMRGKGVKAVGGSHYGDQILHYVVKVPRTLSSNAQRLLEELAVELGEREPAEQQQHQEAAGSADAASDDADQQSGFTGKLKDWMNKAKEGQDNK